MHDKPWTRAVWTMLLCLAGGCEPAPREEALLPDDPPSLPAGTWQLEGDASDPGAAEGDWSARAPMTVARDNPRAAVLNTGHVLLLGNAAAELYDPGADTWTATAAPQLAHRTDFTLTALASGQVLLTGGIGEADDGWPWQKRTELYDPATGTWRTTGPLTQGRAHHTATLLASGKVLVTGGMSTPIAATSSAELYDPATGTWSSAGYLLGALGQTATLLASGQVLVTGGSVPRYRKLESVFLYEPARNEWTRQENMPHARSGHVALRLPSGGVMVLGDSEAESDAVDLYNPHTHQWSSAPRLPFKRLSSATSLPGGEVLAVGVSGQAALYDPSRQLWRLTTPAPRAHGMGATAVALPPGGVLLVGGADAPFAVERFSRREGASPQP